MVDSLPLNSEQDRYQREGITLAYSTLADWLRVIEEALEPLGGALVRETYQYDYWYADETGIAVGTPPLIYYDYQPGRHASRPVELLSKFKGHLQTDGYAAYDNLPNKNIILLNCMARAPYVCGRSIQ